ncbi:uncharacterized protein N7511_000798 [Penicillium nucicola]|uniref:uncharacterized protein n=1 Tax=Penicillium nucicola TaxID=1850975 RepID=UPI002545A981|nr:uncharacterized protein N7511_000798 [Penicillium nucicola]KAJ5775787.1 hypothetical protein N7511_000798 [Penicillium nucicola]
MGLWTQDLISASTNIIAEILQSIGCKPAWDKERFLQHIEDDVQAVVALGTPRSSLVGLILAEVLS